MDTDSVEPFLEEVAEVSWLKIGFPAGDTTAEELQKRCYREIPFDEERDVTLHAVELPLHPNGMMCVAMDEDDEPVKEVTYYPTGGGFVSTEDETLQAGTAVIDTASLAFPWVSMSDLVETCWREGLGIAEVMRRNEEAARAPEAVVASLAELGRAIGACVDRGLAKGKAGEALPGPRGMVRRAPDLYRHAHRERSWGGRPSGLTGELR